MCFSCRGVPRGPHTPLVELGWSLCGKEEARWQGMWHKATLPFLVKGRKRHFWRIFPKEAKLAPTSNSNLEASLRAILEAQSLGEKGGTFRNAWRRNLVHIHPPFYQNSENTLSPSLNQPAAKLPSITHQNIFLTTHTSHLTAHSPHLPTHHLTNSPT